MSRIRDALRKAETWPQQTSAPRTAQPAMGPPVALENSPVALEHPPVALEDPPEVQTVEPRDTGELAHDAEEPVKKPRRSRFPRLRRLLRFFGIHSSTAPVPRCSGLNRRGVPCRAPSMANGFCHAHGGSRHSKLEQQALQLWERVAPHPSNESEAMN